MKKGGQKLIKIYCTVIQKFSVRRKDRGEAHSGEEKKEILKRDIVQLKLIVEIEAWIV